LPTGTSTFSKYVPLSILTSLPATAASTPAWIVDSQPDLFGFTQICA
jgi:hypothetical protein